MRSRKIRFPFFMVRGRSNLAGWLLSSFRQESHVLPRIPTSDTARVIKAREGLNR